MVEVSIIIPALKKPEELYNDLNKQTFKDFEIVLVGGKMHISSAWNRGLEKAKGKKIILLEGDTRVFDNDWLEKMVKLIDTYQIVKADEVIVDDRVDSVCNLGMTASVARTHRFDESFGISEDVEFHEKLRQDNYDIKRTRQPVVWHFKKITVRKAIVWGFDTGVAYARIYLQYHKPNMNLKRMAMSRGYEFIHALMILLGEIYGFVRYSYKIFDKVEDHRTPRKKNTKR